jgi:hypothetical protein
VATSRKPGNGDLAPLLRFYREQATRLAADRAAAATVAGVEFDHCGLPIGDYGGDALMAEKAAWTMVANVVLNLDETMTKE